MSVSLKNEATKFFDLDLGLTSEQNECFKKELGQFCLSGRKEDAFSVYYCYSDIFKIFGNKSTLQELVKLLSDHESYSGELLQKHRDHYSHSVYVFALGLSIYANNKKYRDYIKTFYKGFSDRDFLYYWGLTGLFHDIGYPFQLAHEQVRDYMTSVFGKGNNPSVAYGHMSKLLKLSKEWKEACGFDVKNMNELFARAIDKRMPYLGYERVLHKLNIRVKDTKFMDHAYFSAMLLANEFQAAKVPLTEPLLDSLTAILLHNSLIRHYLAREDSSIPPTTMEVHPLAYMLMLNDEIQSWDRESFGLISKKSPIAWGFDISFDENTIYLKYTFDTKVKEKINGKTIYENNNANKIIAPKEEDGLLKDINTAVKPHVKIVPSLELLPKEKKSNFFASSTILLNLEQLACASHAAYMEHFMSYPNVAKDFENLSLFYKLDNIDQAKAYAYKLELINCLYSEKELDYDIVDQFSEKDAKYLAAQEHVRWVKNRLNYGWTYGKLGEDYTRENRDALKKHQSIIPYEKLSQEEKDKDILTVNNITKFLKEKCDGIKVYSFRNKWKPVLRIFGTGHRNIDLSNKEEVEGFKNKIREIIKEYQKSHRVIVKTNFALGADLLIAEVALELGLSIDACVPYSYDRMIEEFKKDSVKTGYPFTKEDEVRWRNAIAQTIFYYEIEEGAANPHDLALKYNINKSDVMIALWDGVVTKLSDLDGNPINRGGTYHGILLAEERGMPVHKIICRRIRN